MAGMGGIIQGGLPMFDDKIFDDWKIKMMVVFSFEEVKEVIKNGLVELGNKATNEEKKNYKLQQKLDSKARFLLLYQCVTSKIFNKISQVEKQKRCGKS